METTSLTFPLWVSGEDWRAEDIIISKLYWFVDLFAYGLNIFPCERAKEKSMVGVDSQGKQSTELKNLRVLREAEVEQMSNTHVVRCFCSFFFLFMFLNFLSLSISVIPRSPSEETVYITVSSFSFWISGRYSVVEIITQKLQHQLLSLSALIFRYLPVSSSKLFLLWIYSTVL